MTSQLHGFGSRPSLRVSGEAQLHDGPYALCRVQQEPRWTRQRNFGLPYTCVWSSRVPGRGSLLNGVRDGYREKAGNSAFLVECAVIVLCQIRFRSSHGVKND